MLVIMHQSLCQFWKTFQIVQLLGSQCFSLGGASHNKEKLGWEANFPFLLMYRRESNTVTGFSCIVAAKLAIFLSLEQKQSDILTPENVDLQKILLDTVVASTFQQLLDTVVTSTFLQVLDTVVASTFLQHLCRSLNGEFQCVALVWTAILLHNKHCQTFCTVWKGLYLSRGDRHIIP